MSLNSELLKVGVVGLGKMGLLHAGILNVLPEVELIAVCDKSALTRRFFGKMLKNIHVVGDIAQFSELDLDAVYVTTPISSHFAITNAMYQTKIAHHLFVEKTLTASYSKSKELCMLAQRYGGVNMVGYLRRFAVTFMRARQLLKEDFIGEPTHFKAYALSSDFCDARQHHDASTSRGGVLRDLGSHVIDVALWFFGDFHADLAKLESVAGVCSEDSVTFAVHRESDGLKGEFNVSWCVEGYRMPEVGLSINGSKGSLEVDDDKILFRPSNGQPSVWYRHDLDDRVPFWLGAPEYFREDNHFIESIRGNNLTAEPSFETASKVDYIIEQVLQKAAENDQ